MLLLKVRVLIQPTVYREDYLKYATKHIKFVINNQALNGSWYYSLNKNGNWVDIIIWIHLRLSL